MTARRLLFIAHCFPPVTLPGAVRAAKICKFLAAKGWKITVLTPHLSHWASAEQSQEWESRLTKWGVDICTTSQPLAWRIAAYKSKPSRGARWFVEGVGRRILARMNMPRETMWLRGALNAIKKFEPESFDVILATASPYASFQLARDASRVLGCPFVLDYRDLWGTSPHPLPNESLRGVDFEGELCAEAHGILGVSASLVDNLRAHFGSKNGADHDKFHVITNGFDDDDMRPLRGVQRSKSDVVYAGIFYPPKRTVTPIMEAFRWIRDHHPDVGSTLRFLCYGPMSAHVQEEARRCGVTDMVEIKGRVSREDALRAVSSAPVSVVITSVETQGSQADRGIMTSKIFDAMGVGTPVLLIAPEDSDAERVLTDASAGLTFRGRDIEGIAQAILDYTRGEVETKDEAIQSPFSWNEIVERLDDSLEHAIARYAELKNTRIKAEQ